jgi:hypothetical protein
VHGCTQNMIITVEQCEAKQRKTPTMNITNTKKSILTGLTLGAVSLMLASPQAQATPIIGDIGFAGSYDLPAGQNLGDATELLDISAIVVSHNGSYAGIPLTTPATFANPLDVKPSTPPATLWTVVAGLTTYTFGATTSTVTTQGSGSGGLVLDMGGSGWAEIDGLDKTYGTWELTASQTGMAMGFESTASVVGVPDGALTLGLLGSALLALQGLRRKLGC